MDIGYFKNLTTGTVVEPMIEFMEEWDGDGYTRADVEACEALIHRYLEALDAMEAPTDQAIMAQVEVLVLALNDLNEATDYSMIETDQREDICTIIQEAAEACGLREIPDDVTEQWRDW